MPVHLERRPAEWRIMILGRHHELRLRPGRGAFAAFEALSKLVERVGMDARIGWNDVVGAVHQKAMPVILNFEEDREIWLTAPWSEARKLQRPLADGELEIVHRTALKYLPGVEGIPSGDPLRVTSPSKESSLF